VSQRSRQIYRHLQAIRRFGGIAQGSTAASRFISARDLLRRVGADCAVEVDGNAYSVPWRLIGERVRVTVGAGSVRVLLAGREVAVHAELKGRHGRVTDDSHLAGIAGTRGRPVCITGMSDVGLRHALPTLLRPLADYEAAIGGGF